MTGWLREFIYLVDVKKPVSHADFAGRFCRATWWGNFAMQFCKATWRANFAEQILQGGLARQNSQAFFIAASGGAGFAWNYFAGNFAKRL